MAPSEIIQVTNIAPMASREHIRTLFGYLGRIEELVMFPTTETQDCPSKVCYIRYSEGENPLVAMHLNNTVFIDRALIVFPLGPDVTAIPDELEAVRVQAPANTTAGVLPKTAEWPFKVMSMVVGKPGDQSIQTVDHHITNLGLPAYPPLPATTDGNRIEEIRRTVLISNLSADTTAQQVIDFFSPIAEVKYARLAAATGPGSEGDERAAFVEFSEQASVAKAFSLMGGELSGRQVIVQHATCAIIKPASHYSSGTLDDHRKLLSRHQSRSPSIEKAAPMISEDRHRSTSKSRRRSRSPVPRSKRHHRSRSRSRGHRPRGRSGSRSRVRRRSGSKGRRSRSRGRRSRSRGRRSRSRDRRRSRSRGRRSRSPTKGSRSRGKRSRSRDRNRRSRSRDRRRSRSRSRDRRRGGDKKKDDDRRKDKKHSKDKDRDRGRDKDRDRARDKDRERRKEDRAPKEKDESSAKKEEKEETEVKKEVEGQEVKNEEVPAPPPPPPPPPPPKEELEEVAHEPPADPEAPQMSEAQADVEKEQQLVQEPEQQSEQQLEAIQEAVEQQPEAVSEPMEEVVAPEKELAPAEPIEEPKVPGMSGLAPPPASEDYPDSPPEIVGELMEPRPVLAPPAGPPAPGSDSGKEDDAMDMSD